MIITDLKNINLIEKYDVDALIVNSCEFSNFNDKTFKVDELESIVSKIHQNKKKVYLGVDRLITENEIESLKDYLQRVSKISFDKYIFSDFAVLNYFKNTNQLNRLIYNPKTLITNPYEASFYRQQGIEVFIANEITLDDIASIKEGYLEVYGYRQIFYSRRLLFNSYQEYLNRSLELANKLNFLEEEFRSEHYPIFQSDYGTYIYAANIYMLFSELKQIPSVHIKINGEFIEDELIFKVISYYKELLVTNQIEEIKRLEVQISALNRNYANPFLYKGSILHKVNENE